MTDFLGFVITEILYKPVYNLVIYVYNYTPGPNLGWTIIALAIIIRLLFLYFTLKGYKTEQVYNSLLPEAERIEHDTNLGSKEKRKKIVELLRSKQINPYSEIITVLGQFTFLTILYFVLNIGIKPEGFKDLYEFVPKPTQMNTVFFDFDLAKPDLLLSIVASIALYLELYWEETSKPKLTKMRFSEKWYPLLLSSLSFVLLYVLPSAKAVFVFVSVFFSLMLKSIYEFAQEKR